jgi:hypothetical protein
MTKKFKGNHGEHGGHGENKDEVLFHFPVIPVVCFFLQISDFFPKR